VGVVLAGFGLTRGHKAWGLVALATWFAFTILLVDEGHSLVRLGNPSRDAWQEAREQGHAVRVVTLNCLAGNARAAAEVFAYEPDIVLLQESPSRDHLAELSQQFFGADGAFLWGGDTSILARGILLPQHRDGTSHFVHAVVELPTGFRAHVMSVRLSPPVFRLDFWQPGFWRDHFDKRTKHRRQIQDVMIELRRVPERAPLIIGGDFNAPPNDGSLIPLRDRLFDTFRHAGRGWGNTGTNGLPLFRVDQIWASSDCRAVRVVARRTLHSDHRMVVCDLVLGN
jgi:hypothetical protein